MKPFNLEEAKAGRPVITRWGREVEIISFDGRGEYPVLGYIEQQNIIKAWTKDGHYLSSCVEDKNALDLFMKETIIEHEGWIWAKALSTGKIITSSNVYETEEQAFINKIICHGTAVVKIKFKEEK